MRFFAITVGSILISTVFAIGVMRALKWLFKKEDVNNGSVSDQGGDDR